MAIEPVALDVVNFTYTAVAAVSGIAGAITLVDILTGGNAWLQRTLLRLYVLGCCIFSIAALT